MYDATPCFPPEQHQLWCMYASRPVGVPISASIDERRRFLMHPCYVMLNEGRVRGGAWIDRISEEDIAHFHILVDRGFRRHASALLEFLHEDQQKKCEGLFVHWGKRPLKDDPSAFFKRHGYAVNSVPELGGSAEYRF